ncbi:MAG: hypothetical protein WBB45_12610 [Cyclobacteriaceae bacterium]
MQILPWKEVPVYKGGQWKQVTDDGVYSAAGFLSPEWINTFSHSEKHYQGVLVNHFPAAFASMGQGVPSQMGNGITAIGGSMSGLLLVLQQLLQKKKKEVELPPGASALIDQVAELADINSHSMENLSPDKMDLFLVGESRINELIENLTLSADSLLFASEHPQNNEGDMHAMDGGIIAIISALTGAVSLIGTVWNAVSGMQNDPGILKSPWSDYANADGSLTHIYADWYQGSAVRLKWIWGNDERKVFISKRSGQLQRMLDVGELRRRANGQLPAIQKPPQFVSFKADGAKVLEEVAEKVVLPSDVVDLYTSREGEELTPMGIEISSDCPAHVKQSLDRAKMLIKQYTENIRQISNKIPSNKAYAKQIFMHTLTNIGIALSAWGATPPVGVGATILLAINQFNRLEADVELYGLMLEVRTYKHAITEWAGFVQRTRSSHPGCF